MIERLGLFPMVNLIVWETLTVIVALTFLAMAMNQYELGRPLQVDFNAPTLSPGLNIEPSSAGSWR